MRLTIYLLRVIAAMFLFPLACYAVPGPITGPGSVCAGATITLSDATTGGIWSSSATGIATVGSATGIINGAAAGTVTITYTDGTGYVTQTITVNALPIVTASASPGAICSGGSATLTASIPGAIYSVNSIPFSLYSITTLSGSVSGDDAMSATVALPFTFRFYGTNYNSLYVSTDGWVTFTNPFTSSYTNYAIPTVGMHGEIGAGIAFGVHDYATAGYGVTGAGSITYGYSGTAPNRVFIIYFNGLGDYNTSGGGISGQVILYEGSNVIDEMLTSKTGGNPATLGLQSNTATVGVAPAIRNVFTGTVGTPEGWRYQDSTTYLWSPATLLSSATVSNPVSSGATTTTVYTVTATILSGCFGSATVTINAVPIAIAAHNVSNPPDTLCSAPDFYIVAGCTSPSLSVTTFFGDGTSNTTALTSSGTSHADVFHSYSFPGNYYVKQVLNFGTAPVDSVSFSYEYLYCRTLPIKLYFDNNGNCVKDGSEPFSFIPFSIQIDSNGITIDTATVSSGIYYKAYGPPGTVYTFTPITSASGVYASCPVAGILSDTIMATVNSYPVKYFGLSPVPGSLFDLAQYSTIHCGPTMASGTIVVNNILCAPTDATITVNFSPKYFYHSAAPAPAAHSATTIIWNLTNISDSMPVQPLLNFTLTSFGLTPGDTANSSVQVTPITGDVNVLNNSCVRTDTVKSSYDPNYIEVNPQGYISSGTELQYTVHFENTGNDTAHNIYVMDTLSDKLDAHTLAAVAASSEMNIAVFNDGVYNIAKFDLPHINLLDSSHHNQCDGMVVFKIKTLTGLPECTEIPNHAGIFFDYNPVVMTDIVVNIIGTAPNPGIVSGPDSVCVGHEITLADTAAGGIWSSGSTAGISGGVLTGISPGIDTVWYAVTNVCGTAARAYKLVNVLPASVCSGVLNINSPNHVSEVKILPNPANDVLTVVTEKGAYTSLLITNSIGQEMKYQQINATQTKVDIKSLPTGVYYITLRGDNGSKVQKFVKL